MSKFLKLPHYEHDRYQVQFLNGAHATMQVLKQRVNAHNRITKRWLKKCAEVALEIAEVKNLVGPVGKAAVVHNRRDKKDDKKDDDVIEHKGAAVAHRRRK